MPKDKEGLYKARPLLRLKAQREGRCPKCGAYPVRKTKTYREYTTGRIVRKAVCPNGHKWKMLWKPPEKEEIPQQQQQKKEERE